jgi:phosphate transport system protein
MSDKPHTVTSYDDALFELDQSIERMGAVALKLLQDSFLALEKGDRTGAESVIERDREIDRIERHVDETALKLIALRQPLAVDLRHVAAAMKISGDIERIGDLAKNIAKRSLRIEIDDRIGEQMLSLRQISELAGVQLSDVLSAYSKRDAEKAELVWRRDASIDAQYQALFRALLTFMMEDPRNIGSCAHLMFVAKNLERIGDHATNIAEKVFFMVRGEDIPEDRPKGKLSGV